MKILGGLFLFLGLATTGISAQESRQLPVSSYFDEMLTHGIILVIGKPYRKTVTGRTVTEGTPPVTSSEKSVTEFDAAHNGHIIQNFILSKSSKRFESFIVKTRQYKREDDGTWSLMSRYTTADRDKWNEKLGDDAPKPVNRARIISDEKLWQPIGETILGGVPARVFGYTATVKMLDELKNIETTSIIEARFWFDADGVLLKDEYKTDARSSERVSHNLRTTIYEIIPDLKVEIPAEVQSLVGVQ